MFIVQSYVLTALLPVAVPDEGRRGDLLMIPNTRGIRRLYLSNVLDKIAVDNRITQTILRMDACQRMLNAVAIKIGPAPCISSGAIALSTPTNRLITTS